MTETDLFTAEGSTDQESLPTPPSTSETSQDVAAGGSDAAPSAPEAAAAPATTESAPASAPDNGAATAPSDSSLSAMVLPELRALANRVGVKGSSGMRKSELIAAIREVSGNGGNGGSGAEAPKTKTQTSEQPANGAEPAASNEAEPPAAPPRRERRGASR
ncbi:transcription termination factor Rho, partial [Mycolicibacter virginiensis]